MSQRATAVNPTVLTWARRQAGLSVADVATRVKKSESVIAAWEAGTDWPTYNQLEDLADRIYRRPVALFFLPEPPDEPPANEEFRTLPEFDVSALDSDTRYAVRIGRAYQESLRELTGGKNPSRRQLVEAFAQSRRSDIPGLARALRDYLGVSLEIQVSWPTPRQAMTNWRSAIESTGVFVFKRSFKQPEISGFCLTDVEFPIIVINNSTSFTRQIFTLFHEAAHLIFGVNSITTETQDYISRMSGEMKAIEVSCNLLAAEFLMPVDSFPWNQFDARDVDGSIAAIASRYKVSREAVLRRLVDRGLVGRETYSDRVARWSAESEGRGEGAGGNYYATQAVYLGKNYLNLAFSRYRAGIIPIAELAEHLGIKAKHIAKLEEYVDANS